MEQIIEEIKQLTGDITGRTVTAVEKIPQSGSDRNYFRVYTGENSCIATYGKNIKENDTFIYFSRHFRACGSPVPEILGVNDDRTIYLQEYFGELSLLKKIE